MRKLEFVAKDGWDRPVYKDEAGLLWKDVNLGSGKPDLYSSSDNDIEGEPDMPITGEYEITKGFQESGKEFQYMMLSRLKSDCNYYLNHGNRNPHNLYYDDVAEHIKHMKELWNSFKEAEKPEWLTWEQLLKYEEEMLNS